MSYLNPEKISLSHQVKTNRRQYQSNKPFEHIYIDNFFDEEFLNTILEEFESNTTFNDRFDDSNQKRKQTLSDYSQMKTNSKHLIDYLNSQEFIQFVQEITGIHEMLIPDPYLMGGGYHETKRHGFLKLHVDFSKHYKTNLDRRVNLIIFLNKNWKKEYGGDLVLQSKETSIAIEPLFNRLAIFNTTSFNIHGHSDPLMCPENMSRKSIALYYYSNGRPTNELTEDYLAHSTQFMGRNFKEKWHAQYASIRYKTKFYVWSAVPPLIFIIRKKILRRFRSFLNDN